MRTLSGKILMLVLLCAVWNCQQKGNQELYDEVMKVHDEVMPKMDDIHRLKKGLQRELKDSTTLTEPRKAEIQALIVKLDSASDGMMIWMREFNPPPDSEGEEKARNYLLEQQKKVEKVRKDMLDALEAAKK